MEGAVMEKQQWLILLEYLMSHDGITGLQCIEELGIMNYKGRIHDIRKRGYTIKTTYINVPNRRGGYSNVAWYSLKMGAAA
jgi:hypothetical protein